LDPFHETADVDTANNHWSQKAEHVYFKVQK